MLRFMPYDENDFTIQPNKDYYMIEHIYFRHIKKYNMYTKMQ